MIDLIANGFALHNQKQMQHELNPQSTRSESASDNLHGDNKPARSAYSAKEEMVFNKNYLIRNKPGFTLTDAIADYAEQAENQSSTEYSSADLLRTTCGLEDFDFFKEDQPKSSLVQCHSCKHFIPDTIGSGVGIGTCVVGVKWTQQVRGRMPLYRYSERHCVQYKPSPMECCDG